MFARRLSEGEGQPAWWSTAHALLIVADECCSDMGYTLSNAVLGGSSQRFFWANAVAYYQAQEANSPEALIPARHDPSDDRHLRKHVTIDTLDYVVDPNVARVLPKGRTTELGCSMRTLSHNLTLLPPRGFTSAYWHQPAALVEDSSTRLNIVLLPFPFVIPPGSFRGRENRRRDDGRWGRFMIDQRWLRSTPGDRNGAGGWSSEDNQRSFVSFVDRLLGKAEETATAVNALVLPEYALDWATYDRLVRHLRDERPQVEFVISGVSEDCNGAKGNFVVVTTIYTDDDGNRVAATHSRRKHHRWQLDGGQIRSYGLEEDLDPDVVWWEYLEIGHRVVHMDIFRNRSALTAVICEDLARVDPALSLIRSLGPNLVFALLMDGPQIERRWPGTYATSLTDDPGSSVLTLTSAALVDRSCSTFGPGGKRSVGLWRHHVRMDGLAPTAARTSVELELDEQAQALLLRLDSMPAPERTIDGRSNADTTAWYLVDHSELGIEASELRREGWEWITSGRSGDG